jgi:hypothetical protein
MAGPEDMRADRMVPLDFEHIQEHNDNDSDYNEFADYSYQGRSPE